jgi:CheY-like chemotaxis protein
MDYSELKKLTAVFAEDDDEVRKFVSTLLEDFFASLTVVKDGAEAYEAVKNTKPDILITDIMMPKLNGLELIRKLDQDKIRPSIVFVATAYSETNFFLDSIKLKVDGYALKPINIKELFSQILDVITSKRQGKELDDSKKLIDAISVFVGGKKIEIIKHLLEKADEEGIYRGSYEDVMEAVSVSKPTVVSTFKQLSDAGLIERIKNKCYRLKS